MNSNYREIHQHTIEDIAIDTVVRKCDGKSALKTHLNKMYVSSPGFVVNHYAVAFARLDLVFENSCSASIVSAFT